MHGRNCREVLSGAKILLDILAFLYIKGPTPPAASGFRVRGLPREALRFFWQTAMRTIVYVDGFNLYYGRLKNTPWKWLDLVALTKDVLHPKHEIVAVKYFTAKVLGTPDDPLKPQRQNVYLQALQHFRPEVDVYFGHFLRHKVRMPLADRTDGRRMAEVLKTEEKGSDVNLAVHLLNDCWLGRYECAIVISNDSDLAEAMRLVNEHGGKTIGLVKPRRKQRSDELRAHARFVRNILSSELRIAQLPDPIPETTFRKPAGW